MQTPNAKEETTDGKASAGTRFNLSAELYSCCGVMPEIMGLEAGLTLSWGARGIGFGLLTFYKRKGLWEADDECMGGDFCAQVVESFADTIESTAQGTPPSQITSAKLDKFSGEWNETTYEFTCGGFELAWTAADGSQGILTLNYKSGKCKDITAGGASKEFWKAALLVFLNQAQLLSELNN